MLYAQKTLILDKEDQLDDVVPTCDWGSVIISTRLSNLTSFGECVEVEGIGAEAGLELIVKSPEKRQQSLDESEFGEAQEIFKVLGEPPLALDQAGAYISYLRIPFSVYRQMIRKGLTDLFNKKLPGRALSSVKAGFNPYDLETFFRFPILSKLNFFEYYLCHYVVIAYRIPLSLGACRLPINGLGFMAIGSIRKIPFD
ncbi:hypothetical protein RUND412_002816 [Rhizina undulata]